MRLKIGGLAPYTIFLVILMFGLFVFALIILSEWLNVSFPFLEKMSCTSARIKYCEEWKRTGIQPTYNFPEGCKIPTKEECGLSGREAD